MFSGIVSAIGNIEAATPIQSGSPGLRLRIYAPDLGLDSVAIGDSIAVQGACMTVIWRDNARFEVEVSAESLDKTRGLSKPGPVNLEKSLRLSDVLGGHLVTGHVDGVGFVRTFEPVGESWRLEIDVPAALGRFFAYKGSVTVDGVSLTVNSVVDLPVTQGGGTRININLIPHTIAKTTLKRLSAGDEVNIEVDLVARYLERLATAKPVQA